MEKRCVVLPVIAVIAFGILTCNVSAITYGNLSGIKSFDYNQNGQLDGNGFLLPGWTINLYYEGGGFYGSTTTNQYGYYNFTGLDRDFNYTVTEEVQTGWHNTSRASYTFTFNQTDGPPDYGADQFNATEEDLASRMWNTPYADSRTLLGFNHRIGDVTGTKDPEIKIFEPLGNWNPGASSTDLSPSGDVTWVNNVFQSFNDTWVPISQKQQAIVEVGGSSVTQNLDPSATRLSSMPIRDIVIRLHSENANYKVEIDNLQLKQGSTTVSLTPDTFSWNGSSASAGQDYYRVIRASRILTNNGGTNISVGGFSLTGDIRFAWTGAEPKMNNLKMDVYVGRFQVYSEYDIVRNFANHINGTVSGYKLDTQGVGLPNWNITCTNETLSVFEYNVTNESGYYLIRNIPPGYFLLNESGADHPGWTAVPGEGNRTIYTDLSNLPSSLNLINQNFTNQQIPPVGNISGYKFQDVYGNGTFLIPLANWTITLANSTSEFGSTTTAGNGFFNFTGVPNGTYFLNETLQYGWRNTSPASYPVTIATDGEELVRNFTNEQYLANITGVKFNDGNHDGIYEEDVEPLIEGWNISVYYQNGTYIASQFTDSDGMFNFGGLDKEEEYVVQEEQPAGWVGTTPDSANVDFANLSICPGTFHIDNDALLLARMPNARLVFVPESRIGSNTLSGDYEMDIHYIDPVFTVPVTAQKVWINGTDYNFNMTYNPLTEIVTYTVDGTSISMPAHHPLTAPFLFSDFAIRTRATRAGSQIDVYNLSLSVQGVNIPIEQTAFGETNTSQAFGPGSPGDLDILWIRANYMAQRIDPSLDVMNGFTLTGTQRMTWDSGNMPTASQLAYTIKVGKPICPLDTNRFVVFGNYQYNNVSGFKNEDPVGDGTNGTPLSGWNISLWDEDGTKLDQMTTDSQGYYSFQNLTFGNYTINETLQDGWTLTHPPGGYYSVFINATYLEYGNLNFTNNQQPGFGNISGYKLDPGDTGLGEWEVNVYYENGTLFDTNLTDTSGYFRFDPVPFGNYTVTETLQDGWTQTAPPGGYHEVNMTSGSLVFEGLNFTNQRSLCLSGYKLDENNGPQAGWTITVRNATDAETGREQRPAGRMDDHGKERHRRRGRDQHHGLKRVLESLRPDPGSLQHQRDDADRLGSSGSGDRVSGSDIG
ncbi:MAG: SpaA isopeptide-forming pilin-related protein [Methanolinea sp.]|nr:SpaA isopeptide-forming pilin-related protein [Methanolinea sp.]